MSEPCASPGRRPTIEPGPWPVTAAEAEDVQRRLRARVEVVPAASGIDTVAGVDVAYDTGSDLVAGAVVVLDAASLSVVVSSTVVGRAAFPYVPGLLAFRELPTLVTAWNRLPPDICPDLVVCDGYGLAHPRRFGLACHFGVLTGLPTFGVGKTAFVGAAEPPPAARGGSSPLIVDGEVVGRALRTQDGVKEVHVSVGHRIELDQACAHVLALTPRFRLPQTTRAADQAARRVLRSARAARMEPKGRQDVTDSPGD
ncbi:endonuclease V [Parafrankia discariae]|uniref:endonuclease V n=1 Tax=Parafrankia discariae TaxID=365528 RepID=UPI0003742262|nr:endonuclease V [Parafrankia discariae]